MRSGGRALPDLPARQGDPARAAGAGETDRSPRGPGARRRL